MTPRLYMETYGCQMNDYEADRVFRMFHERLGYERTDAPALADLVIFNTCTIRGKADQKALSSIGQLREIKEERPGMVIAVGGCLSQVQGSQILERFPHVDLVFGTHQWMKLPDWVEEARHGRRILETDLAGWKDYRFLPYPRSDIPHPVCELVTVQNGCDKFCTFCVVPFVRGRQVSRPAADVEGEVRSLVERGVKEVTLLGQNVNAYGKDRSGEISFVDLLQRVCAMNGLERVRFISSHPAEMSRDLMDLMAEDPKLGDHLHLPLQSGSDRVLAKMNRGHIIKEFRDTITYLIKIKPDISITTDFIVGFPEETEEDFQATLNALHDMEFSDSFSFVFSPRPHTKAAQWKEGLVPSQVGRERLARLQALQRETKNRKNRDLKGRTLEILVEGKAKRGEGLLTGRSRCNRTVNFSGPPAWIGRLVRVRIAETLSNSLRGEGIAD